MSEQMSFIPMLGEDVEELKEQAKKLFEYDERKRKWENAFQKWSNSQWEDDYTSLGKCGYGSMCDWCKDNSYGRPCVRALNKMLREKRIKIDYSKRDFEKIWRGEREGE